MYRQFELIFITDGVVFLFPESPFFTGLRAGPEITFGCCCYQVLFQKDLHKREKVRCVCKKSPDSCYDVTRIYTPVDKQKIIVLGKWMVSPQSSDWKVQGCIKSQFAADPQELQQLSCLETAQQKATKGRKYSIKTCENYTQDKNVCSYKPSLLQKKD